jgi:hypothetical protein
MYWRIGSAYRRRPSDASTFARAGFKTIARRDPARPVMRHDLNR